MISTKGIDPADLLAALYNSVPHRPEDRLPKTLNLSQAQKIIDHRNKEVEKLKKGYRVLPARYHRALEREILGLKQIRLVYGRPIYLDLQEEQVNELPRDALLGQGSTLTTIAFLRVGLGPNDPIFEDLTTADL